MIWQLAEGKKHYSHSYCVTLNFGAYQLLNKFRFCRGIIHSSINLEQSYELIAPVILPSSNAPRASITKSAA